MLRSIRITKIQKVIEVTFGNCSTTVKLIIWYNNYIFIMYSNGSCSVLLLNVSRFWHRDFEQVCVLTLRVSSLRLSRSPSGLLNFLILNARADVRFRIRETGIAFSVSLSRVVWRTGCPQTARRRSIPRGVGATRRTTTRTAFFLRVV